MKKVYVAGPCVFRHDAKEYFSEVRNKLNQAGFEALIPIDNESTDHLDIKVSNQDMLIQCDYVIANISPFRGASCDAGTAYEIGFAEALGKVVFMWSEDQREYKKRVYDMDCVNDMIVENFGLKENLMIDIGGVTWKSFDDALFCLKIWEYGD